MVRRIQIYKGVAGIIPSDHFLPIILMKLDSLEPLFIKLKVLVKVRGIGITTVIAPARVRILLNDPRPSQITKGTEYLGKELATLKLAGPGPQPFPILADFTNLAGGDITDVPVETDEISVHITQDFHLRRFLLPKHSGRTSEYFTISLMLRD